MAWTACRVEFLEQEAERLAEQHESEKQLLQRQADMQRQSYESQLKRVRATFPAALSVTWDRAALQMSEYGAPSLWCLDSM